MPTSEKGLKRVTTAEADEQQKDVEAKQLTMRKAASCV